MIPGLPHLRWGAPFEQKNLLAWWEFDLAHVSIDVGLEVVTSRVTGRTLSQTTDADQPPHEPSDYTGNDRASAQFANDTLVSDDSNATWIGFSDGATGIKAKWSFRPQGVDSTLMATRVTGEGAQLTWDATNETLTYLVEDQSNNTIVNLSLPNGSVPDETTAIATVTVSGSTVTLECCGATATATGITWNSSGTPESAMVLGGTFTLFALVIWGDATADSDLRCEYYLREFWCEYGIPKCVSVQRSDRNVGYSTPPSVNAWDSHRGQGEDFSGSGSIPVRTPNDPALGGKPSIQSSTSADELSATTAYMPCVVCTGAMVSLDGPLWSQDEATTSHDRWAIGVKGGKWYVYLTNNEVSDDVDSGIAADTETRTFVANVYTVGETVTLDLQVDGIRVIDGETASTPDGLSLTTASLFYSPEGGEESEAKIGRWAGFDDGLTDYEILVATWCQRKWARLAQLQEATLLSVLNGLGFSLLWDLYTPSSYTLSGATLIGLTNRISGVAATIAGSPTYSATALGGGPGLDTCDASNHPRGSEAAVLAHLTDLADRTVIVVAEAFNVNNTRVIFSAGDTASSNDNVRIGTSAAGEFREVILDDTTAALLTASTSGDDDPHVLVVTVRDSDNTNDFWIDGTKIIDAQAVTDGTCTPVLYGLGHRIKDTPDLSWVGGISLLAIGPRVSDAEMATINAALSAHHSVLAGLLL